MSTIEDCEAHVQFKIDKDELRSHHETVEITRIDQDKFTVNLGYLKIDHYYQFSFDLHYEAENFRYLTEKSSKYLKFKELVKKSDKIHTMTFICFTHKQKNDKEDVYFETIQKNPETGLDEITTLNIMFEAKVLGQFQGTPSLRSGVSIIQNYSESAGNAHFNCI